VKAPVEEIASGRPVLLFDGVCNLCNASVLFVIRRDRRNYFRFASLQSEAGQALLEGFHLPANEFETFVLVEDGRCFVRSTAALRVVRRLNGLWPLLYTFILIPRPIRDFFYDLIARRRYRWFGKREACMVPKPELQSRFLD
jgi:predicted DCC family thiol-disulfide oxidoreductase YuxK